MSINKNTLVNLLRRNPAISYQGILQSMRIKPNAASYGALHQKMVELKLV